VRLYVLGVLAAGLVLGACGEREISPPLAKVELTVEGPADAATVDDDRVVVRGSVVPASATVLVDGEQVGVRDGAFSTTVALEAGTNVIDVFAGAPRHPSAMTALRVTRLVRVEIPELEGRVPDEALAELDDLGLQPDLQNTGTLLDELLPGEEGVCGTDPPAGTEVPIGSSVVIGYAKRC
jgi:hypothetical protein